MMKSYQTLLASPTQETLYQAARLLQAGELVAFPTETVYGLGANALNEQAVLEIFKAKGRPADNPLIVHIWDAKQLDGICEVPPLAVPLMDAFWPGPLTILMPRLSSIPDVVTASLPTVAVRMPSHPVARQLLQACGLPIAAPSANLSGKPSPTTAQSVMEDMRGRIPMILDGGQSEVGLESTVLDLCHGTPTILRPGGVTKEMLEGVIGQVQLAGSILRPLKEGEQALSPGMRYRHYAPKGQVTLVEGTQENVLSAMRSLARAAQAHGETCCLMAFSEHVPALSDFRVYDLGSVLHPEETAHRLFEILRKTEEDGMSAIFFRGHAPAGHGPGRHEPAGARCLLPHGQRT